jgi:hypothetical protein
VKTVWKWIALILSTTTLGVAGWGFVNGDATIGDAVNYLLTFLWSLVAWMFDANTLLLHGMQLLSELLQYVAGFLPSDAASALTDFSNGMVGTKGQLIAQVGFWMMDQIVNATVAIDLFVAACTLWMVFVTIRIIVLIVRWMPTMGGSK